MFNTFKLYIFLLFSFQDAIEDSIRKNTVPIVQYYLLQQNSPELASLSEVTRLGLLQGIKYLMNAKFDEASLLITNLVRFKILNFDFCCCKLKFALIFFVNIYLFLKLFIGNISIPGL